MTQTGHGEDAPTSDGMGAASVLLERLGSPICPTILTQALTHRSYAYEHGGLPTNERLEFLGDAVLGLIVTDALFHDHMDYAEGQLAKLRAAVVNMRALADIGRELGLGDFLRLGRGEDTTGGRDKSSILADCVEAIIGASYVSTGLEPTRELVLRLIGPLLASSERLGAGLDWKTSLQELCARHGLGVPEYRIDKEGPDHAKVFKALVVIGESHFGEGGGRSKKEAEQEAAARTWKVLREESDADPLTGDPAMAGKVASADQVGSSSAEPTQA